MSFQWRLSPSKTGALLNKNPYETPTQALAHHFQKQRPREWKEAMDALSLAKTTEEDAVDEIKKRPNVVKMIKETVEASTKDARDTFKRTLDTVLDEEESGVYTRASRAKRNAKRAKIVRAATKAVYTNTGNRNEAASLQRSAASNKRQYTAGNAKWYKMYIPGIPRGGWMYGKIDGFEEATGTLIEAKERQNRFLGETSYERVQVFMYMKMLKCTKAIVVETFDGEQREHPIRFDEEEWQEYYTGLKKCICNLNKALVDLEYRKELAKSLSM